MPETPESLLGLVNGSGFPFQLKLHDAINQSAPGHDWKVVSSEHRWIDSLGNEGFIDLVLGASDTQRVVIEAKRTAVEGQWVFLLPRSLAPVGRAKAAWSICPGSHNSPVIAWSDFRFEPASVESYFCVVRGQSERDKPMLERIAGILVRSVEALAQEEAAVWQRAETWNQARVYVPVIVTNATLSVCKFDPNAVDLLTGEIASGSAEITPVPVVRFRKSLSTGIDVSSSADDISKIDSESARTVFVVNANYLIPFLTNLHMYPLGAPPRWPWQNLTP